LTPEDHIIIFFLPDRQIHWNCYDRWSYGSWPYYKISSDESCSI